MECWVFGARSGRNWSNRAENPTWELRAQFCAEQGFFQIATPKFVPKPEKIEIATMDDFNACHEYSYEVDDRQVCFCRGSSADIVRLESGQVCYFATADCPTVAVTDWERGVIFCGHASWRNTLAHDNKIPTGIAELVMEQVSKPTNVTVRIICGIQRIRLDPNDPKYRSVNEGYLRFASKWGSSVFADEQKGIFDLPELITEQFIFKGVPRSDIIWDGIDTYQTKSPSSQDEYAFHSFSRQRENGWKQGDEIPSNGILISNRFK